MAARSALEEPGGKRSGRTFYMSVFLGGNRADFQETVQKAHAAGLLGSLFGGSGGYGFGSVVVFHGDCPFQNFSRPHRVRLGFFFVYELIICLVYKFVKRFL